MRETLPIIPGTEVMNGQLVVTGKDTVEKVKAGLIQIVAKYNPRMFETTSYRLAVAFTKIEGSPKDAA